MKILVVLVGNSVAKLRRLKNLYRENIPDETHMIIEVYNGNEDYPLVNKCENNRSGKDVAMYAHAVKRYKADFYFFMNDDVCYIKDKYWLENALRLKTEIVGIQTNLASIVPHKLIKKIAGGISQKIKAQGTYPQFIRTSAFGCTREYFLRVWKRATGSAQRFEKLTLRLAGSYALFADPWYIYDENLRPYAKEMQK